MNEFDPLKLDNQICFPLYAASREVIKRYHPLLADLDLTYTQYVCMMVLWEHRSISSRELGEKLFLDSGTLTPVLKSMEAKGLITRARSDKDERVLTVTLTEAGMALRKKAEDIPAKLAGCIKMDPADAIQLHSLLYKLLNGISDK